MDTTILQQLDTQVYKRRPDGCKFHNIYDGFDASKYKVDVTCGGSFNEQYFIDLFDEIKPSLIIELGSFLGFSCTYMSKLCKKYRDDFRMFTVDTWTINWHYSDVLNWINGYPTTYYQFIANLHHYGLEKNVYPIPLPTSVAINNPIKESLDSLNLKVDMVYVDAGHDFFSVYTDCHNYFPLIKEGGVLFGDDYGSQGVSEGVGEFCRVNDLNVEVKGINWHIYKK